MMGDGRVGTSSLIKKFTRGQFETDYKPEVAKVMRHTKTVFSPQLNTNVTVQFWDIEGSDVKTALLCAQKAHAVGVVYDITNRSSFELAQRLLDGVNPRASVILIANKIDLKEQRKVSYQEGRLLAKIHRVEYLEASAKLNHKVDESFSIIINSVPEVYLRSGSRDSAGMMATRRWQITGTIVCASCKATIKDKENPKTRSKEKLSDTEQSRRLSTRRRVRSDPEYERSVVEKSISI
jgi:small GTP-binding protein